MNDKTTKNIIIITIISVVAALFIWAAIATACAAVSNRKYDKLVEQHRHELELARVETERYRSVINEAARTNNDIGEYLQQSICSIQELRGLISEIRKKYQEMENLLYSVDTSECNTITDNSNNNISD